MESIEIPRQWDNHELVIVERVRTHIAARSALRGTSASMNSLLRRTPTGGDTISACLTDATSAPQLDGLQAAPRHIDRGDDDA